MYIVYMVDYRIGHWVIWPDLGRAGDWMRPTDCVWMVPGTI
jgi:hypothetical protein